MKDLKRFCILSLILLLISAAVIVLAGRTYEVNFFYNPDSSYSLNLENETGEVEILEEIEKGNRLTVKVGAKKPGRVFLLYENGEYQREALLYVHPSLLITDNSYFGRSRWSEILPVLQTAMLLYAIHLIYGLYRNSVNDNLYQYKNITYLGIIIFLSFFAVDTFLSVFYYQGLFGTVSNMISSISSFSIILFPIALITFVLVTISNISLIRREGRSFRNMLGLFLGVFTCIMTLLPDFVYRVLMRTQKVDIYNLNSIGPYLYNFIEALVYLTISYLECILAGTIIIAIKAVKRKIKPNKDYMIILGCQIQKDGSLTPLLKGRVDRALEFRNEQLQTTGKDLVFIPSGGKGDNETISEAQAMKNYLLNQGIKEENILLEGRSANTDENIKFSNQMIRQKDASIAFCTTNYHVLRAGLIATEQGLKLEGIGSKTKTYFWINAFIREFIGTLYYERKKHIAYFVLTAFFILLMILITYAANNM
ncbi:MAG: YdcF family protein [Erysipelotrichaceae bacterium]|nr:YdcF family protein [Erysipelotrichaceae bacterium]